MYEDVKNTFFQEYQVDNNLKNGIFLFFLQKKNLNFDRLIDRLTSLALKFPSVKRLISRYIAVLDAY